MANSWALGDNQYDPADLDPVEAAKFSNWDMYLTSDNKIARTVGVDQVAQHIKERLQFFFEEWFLDRDAGVPWYQDIFVKPENIGLAEAHIKKEIVETRGVISLLAFSTEFDKGTRGFKVISFTVDTDYGLLTETI